MKLFKAEDLRPGDIIAYRGDRAKVVSFVDGRVTAQTYRDTLTIYADHDYQFRVVGGGREGGND